MRTERATVNGHSLDSIIRPFMCTSSNRISHCNIVEKTRPSTKPWCNLYDKSWKHVKQIWNRYDKLWKYENICKSPGNIMKQSWKMYKKVMKSYGKLWKSYEKCYEKVMQNYE